MRAKLIMRKSLSKKYGDCYTYELVDVSEIPEGAKLPNLALKARSYNLGNAYGPEALREQIELYERVGIKEEFTEIGEDFEADIIPKMTFTAKEKVQHNEKPGAFFKTALPIEKVHENLTVALTEDEEETETFSEENDAEVSDNIMSATAKPARRKKQHKKAAPDYRKRSAQLTEVVDKSMGAEVEKIERVYMKTAEARSLRSAYETKSFRLREDIVLLQYISVNSYIKTHYTVVI